MTARLRFPLTFVESDELFSLYRDRDGEDVYLAHGTGYHVLTPYDQVNLAQSWYEFQRANGWKVGFAARQQAWLDELRLTVTEPDLVDDIVWCLDCSAPMDSEDSHCNEIADGHLCETCYDRWYTCDRCDERVREVSGTLNDDLVCESCRGDAYSWCDSCGGYYQDEDSDEHQHGHGSGCCESPALEFTLRNDGEEPLHNDTRVTVTLPAGVITAEGMAAISQYLWRYGYEQYDSQSRDPEHNTEEALARQRNYLKLSAQNALVAALGCTWQTRQGNFTKRLSRHAFKTYGLKLPPEIVSQIGCIAREHSTAVDYHLEVTRNLNLSASEFGNAGSCWWGGYEESRCALKSNGGFGMRTFATIDGEACAHEVTGRAWMLPLTKDGETFKPTFNTHPDAFAVFNGYGILSGYAPARVLAHMAGMTYRKINFDCSPMFVNGGSGYLVAPEEIAQPYTDGNLCLRVATHSNLFETEGAYADVA